MELAGQTCMPTSYDSHDFKNAPTVAQEFHFFFLKKKELEGAERSHCKPLRDLSNMDGAEQEVSTHTASPLSNRP